MVAELCEWCTALLPHSLNKVVLVCIGWVTALLGTHTCRWGAPAYPASLPLPLCVPTASLLPLLCHLCALPFQCTSFPTHSGSRCPCQWACSFVGFYSCTCTPASLHILFPTLLPAHSFQSVFLFLHPCIYAWSLSYPLHSLSACVTAHSYSYTPKYICAPFSIWSSCYVATPY